jgi:hypothetical protein
MRTATTKRRTVGIDGELVELADKIAAIEAKGETIGEILESVIRREKLETRYRLALDSEYAIVGGEN